MRAAAAAVAVLAACGTLAAPAHAAPVQAARACELAPGRPAPTSTPWASKHLAFDRVWPLTRGGGVTVAVVGSGAGSGHPMLAGRVSDTIDLTRTGDRDCTGHGTAVTALIGGRDLTATGVPVTGVAPQARLVAVKQQNAESDPGGGARLPRAIRAAADSGAEVINVSLRAAASPELERAVRYALGKDAVVVAAAGNADRGDGDQGPAYPAGYPGVLSVAGMASDGSRVRTSSLRSKVDIAAPGQDLVVPWPGGGYDPAAAGTSYAAAYVSGVAALVRSRHPGLDRRQVVHRLITTADGSAGDGTGHGMVNPVQAVTAVLPAGAPRQRAEPVALTAPADPDERTRGVAFAVTAGALGAAALAVLVGAVWPMGRRRGWRPGCAAPAAPDRADAPVAMVDGRGTIGT